MRLIDADKLYPDSVSIKGDRLCISQGRIANAPTVDVLDKIRAEIKTKYDDIPYGNNDYDDGWVDALEWVFEDVIDQYRREQA